MKPVVTGSRSHAIGSPCRQLLRTTIRAAYPVSTLTIPKSSYSTTTAGQLATPHKSQHTTPYESHKQKQSQELWQMLNSASRYARKQKGDGSTFKILLHDHKIAGIHFRILIGSWSIQIPPKQAKAWELDSVSSDQRRVRLAFDLQDGPHENRYAEKAIDTDDAARLGIQMTFADNEPVWLKRSSCSAVAVANSFADWVSGKIVDVEVHDWKADRLPFMGAFSHFVSHRSWDAYFRDPEARKALDSSYESKPKWELTETGVSAFQDLKQRTTDVAQLRTIDSALEHLEVFGYIPGGIFASHQTNDNGYKWRLRFRQHAPINKDITQDSGSDA